MSNAKAKSPYQRKQKKPFQYSEQYRAWRAAVAKHGATSPEARHASNVHKAKFLGAGQAPLQRAA